MTDWNKRYAEGQHITDKPHPLLVDFASKLGPGRALDLACGPGRHAIWLAQRGWHVTAVDSSSTAIDILENRAREERVTVDSVVTDLERQEFVIEPERYNLIIVCNYLQRDLFPFIRAGTRVGGVVIAVIAMFDDDPNIRVMNPAFLLNAGELRAQFEGWELMHDFEGKPGGKPTQRTNAEIVARRRG